jgi:hypothetical protein
MNVTRVFSIYLGVLTIVMTGVLVFGFTQGDFWAEGGILTDMPWGIVSLFDVYVGFLLFCAWIWYREPRFWVKALLTLAILLGGNAVSALYAWIILLRSKGDLRVFFLGRFASSVDRDPV